MTTDEATERLARQFVGTPGDRSHHLLLALRAGRAWEWEEAGKQLERAYAVLRATAPLRTFLQAGRAWHRGEHPIQVRAADIEMEELHAIAECGGAREGCSRCA